MFINTKYLKKRNYSFSPHDVSINENHIVWGYYDNTNLIAWSKIYQYNGALESVYFSWDSDNMSLNLGINSLYHEIAWAKSLGYDFLYIGPGYEICSKYKAQVDGFEFWDGMCWSTNINQYLELCDKETGINSFKSYQNLIYNAN
jgi:arginyl-tRNA--protein-N-Asp/Glu arginylyltransferase